MNLKPSTHEPQTLNRFRQSQALKLNPQWQRKEFIDLTFATVHWSSAKTTGVTGDGITSWSALSFRSHWVSISYVICALSVWTYLTGLFLFSSVPFQFFQPKELELTDQTENAERDRPTSALVWYLFFKPEMLGSLVPFRKLEKISFPEADINCWSSGQKNGARLHGPTTWFFLLV